LPPTGSLAVSLDGSASFDPQGRPLTFRWRQAGGPAVALSSSEVASPAFSTAFPGVHAFELTVASATARAIGEIDVVVDPSTGSVPAAAITPLPQNRAATGDKVLLTGSSPNVAAEAATFQWVQVGGPLVALAGASSATPEFTPATAGTYSFELYVSDGSVRSPAAAYAFTVVPGAATNPATPIDPGTGGSPGGDVGTGSGGGGGGCHAGRTGGGDPFVVVLLAGPVALLLLRRRRGSRSAGGGGRAGSAARTDTPGAFAPAPGAR
jgi:hypothetical protein